MNSSAPSAPVYNIAAPPLEIPIAIRLDIEVLGSCFGGGRDQWRE